MENNSGKPKKKLAAKYIIRRALALAVLAFVVVFSVSTAARCHREREEAVETAAVANPHDIVNPYVSYTYEQLLADSAELAESYPGLIELSSAGSSVEGRDLVQLKLGKGEKIIVLTGVLHGCEGFNSGLLMYMIDRYAYGYELDLNYEDYSYRELLDGVSFIILPMVNPDGMNIAVNGPDAAADPDNIYSMDTCGTGYYAWKSNANGVDINRNFPFNWSHYTIYQWPSLRYYEGPQPGSEPETQAIINLLESTDFCMLADFHTYGEIIYWTDNLSGDTREEHRELAELLKETSGYGDAGIEDVDQFGGYLSNYARGVFGVFAATIEVTPYWGYSAEDGFDEAGMKAFPLPLVMAEYALREDAELEGETADGGEAALEDESGTAV
ncbi:MAG: M14 family zinc carboxypeptidase [Oscillospiraceae bacterium]|nr:M14 family zinc carboxypeptidase [Oscillospiraceae bacterium]